MDADNLILSYSYPIYEQGQQYRANWECERLENSPLWCDEGQWRNTTWSCKTSVVLKTKMHMVWYASVTYPDDEVPRGFPDATSSQKTCRSWRNLGWKQDLIDKLLFCNYTKCLSVQTAPVMTAELWSLWKQRAHDPAAEGK